KIKKLNFESVKKKFLLICMYYLRIGMLICMYYLKIEMPICMYYLKIRMPICMYYLKIGMLIFVTNRTYRLLAIRAIKSAIKSHKSDTNHHKLAVPIFIYSTCA